MTFFLFLLESLHMRALKNKQITIKKNIYIYIYIYIYEALRDVYFKNKIVDYDMYFEIKEK